MLRVVFTTLVCGTNPENVEWLRHFNFGVLEWELMIFTQEVPLTRKWFSGKSCIGSNWNLEMLIFEERGKPENPEKNLWEQSKEPTTNLTHSWP